MFVDQTGEVRADRLVAALLLLQTRGRITAQELADELEISVKTARRDLEALGLAGFPVYSQPGRHGGWQLLGGGRTDLSGLTAGEARALFEVAGTAVEVTPDLRAALRKLVRALPESFRAGAVAAAESVVIDPRSWGRRADIRPRFVSELQAAAIELTQVRLGYRDRARMVSERVVDPYGLVVKGGAWYLVASTDQGLRSFRVDRVEAVEVLPDTFQRPADFDLSATWESIVGRVEELRSPVRAEIRTSRWIGELLRQQHGSDVEIGESLPDDRVEMVMRGGQPAWIAERLAGWGGQVEVVSPLEVRVELARLAREVLDLYARDVVPAATSGHEAAGDGDGLDFVGTGVDL